MRGASACRISFRPPPAKGGGRGIFVYKPWHATTGQGDCGIYLLTTASGNGFVGRYLRPLGLSACGGRKPGGLLSKPSSQRRMPSNKDNPNRAATDTNRSAPGAGAPTGDFWERSGQHEPRRVPGHGALPIEVVFQKAQARQRSRSHQNDTRHEPKRPGSGYPHRRSGSEADSMSRGGYPVTGHPSSKSSSIGHTPSNEAVPTRITPDTNQSAPGAGTPTGDFWKRSGQHEPRRVPGHGAPSIEVVFQRLPPVN